MSRRPFIVGLSVVAVVTVLASACGSSPSSSPPGDAGSAGDSGDSGGRTKDSGRKDAPQSKDAAPETTSDTGPADAPFEAGPCTGLDAADTAVGFSKQCGACIGSHCCADFQTCFADEGCKAIEICTGKCIEKGGTPLTCSEECQTASDSGASQSNAQTLDFCIVNNCPGATQCRNG